MDTLLLTYILVPISFFSLNIRALSTERYIQQFCTCPFGIPKIPILPDVFNSHFLILYNFIGMLTFYIIFIFTVFQVQFINTFFWAVLQGVAVFVAFSLPQRFQIWGRLKIKQTVLALLCISLMCLFCTPS